MASLNPGKPFDAALKPWSAQRTELPGLDLPGLDLERFFAVLRAAGERDRLAERVGDVEVDVELLLDIRARVERRRRVRTEGRIDRVADEEIDAVVAVARAHIPVEPLAGHALEPATAA